MTLLIVEDDTDLADSLRATLEEAGFTCWSTATAGEAIRRLSAGPDAPDAILLDLCVPGIPAQQFLRFVRTTRALAHIPVVLTTAALETTIPPGLDVAAILPKPFTSHALRATLRSALAQSIFRVGSPAP